MSTNYYLTPSEGSPLQVYGQIHIGKQSAGWVFSFQGYDIVGGKTQVEVDRTSGLKVWIDVPSLVAKSAFQWSEITMHGDIYSEYGEPVSHEEFWNERICKPSERYSGKPVRVHAKEYNDYGRDWVDAEGYSFSGYDFF